MTATLPVPDRFSDAMMKKYFLSGVRNDDDEDEDDEEDDDSRANNFYKLYAHMPTLQARQTRGQAKRSDRLKKYPL